jgi:hypothetical protein
LSAAKKKEYEAFSLFRQLLFFATFVVSDAPPCLAARSFWRCFSEEANYSKAPASWQGFS